MLSKKEVFAMSKEELYNILLPTIKSFYEKYKKDFGSEEYKIIVLDSIEETMKSMDNNDDFIEQFKRKLLLTLTTSNELSGTNALNDYLKEISKYPLLSAEEEREDLLKIKAGDQDAKDHFVKSNLRLVVYIAKMHVNNGIPLEDLIQEGNIGLLKAIEMFDLEKGTRFSTYACWWIKQSVTRAIADKGRTIRLPVHVVESINDYKKSVKRLTEKLYRNPTPEEIAEDMKVSLARVNELRKYQCEIISLSAPVGEEQDSELENFIPSEDDGPDEESFKRMLPELMKEALDNSKLSERELDVIRYRFGFYDGKLHTLEETGKRIHVTRERIRQIEAKAKRKLSNARSMKKMAWWIKQDGDNSNTPQYYNLPRNTRNDSLYQLLYKYRKEEVDYVLSRLKSDERELIEVRFGKNLSTPNISELSKQETSRLFRVIIPKMEKMLYALTKTKADDKAPLSEKKKMLCNNLENDNSQQKADLSKKGLDDLELGYVIGNLRVKLESTDNKYKLDAYLQLFNFLSTKEFQELLESLSVKEAVLVVLKTGLVDEKYYTKDDLMDILGISEFELNYIIKETLICFRNKLTNKRQQEECKKLVKKYE